MRTQSIFAFICALCFSLSTQAGVMLQGFYWDARSANESWWDRLALEAPGLSRAGFTAVWLPPVLKAASGGFSSGYDPYDDYDIGSKDQRGTIGTRWGTREQLQRTVAVLRANELEVYLDIVLAHRNGDDGSKHFMYRNAQGKDKSGRFPKGPTDFYPWNSDFGRPFDFRNSYVSDNLKNAGDWLTKTLDIQGYRIDAAKHLDRWFLRDYLNHGAMAGKFTVAEFWDENRDAIAGFSQDMGGRSAVFDFPLWGKLRAMCAGRGYFNMREMVGVGYAAIDPIRAVTFVENHDTDRDHPIRERKHLAYAYILTTEGYPAVFWKDYFDYGMRDFIDNLVWIHENLAGGRTESRWVDDDVFAFERTGGPRLLVALNDNMVSTRTIRVATGFGGGVLLQDYSGQQPQVRTDADGSVTIRVAPNSYIAYSRAGMKRQPAERAGRDVTQEFAGAPDLDVPPADHQRFVRVGRVYVAGGTDLKWEAFVNRKGWGPRTAVDLVVRDENGQIKARQHVTAATAIATEQVGVKSEGWYSFDIRSSNTPAENLDPSYWLKVTYRAPTQLP